MYEIMKKSEKERQKKYQRTKNGLVTRIYGNQRAVSRTRGYKMPTYTRQELKTWFWNQKNAEKLYNDWVNSNYLMTLRPSIDRIDDYKSYTFDNIQLMTWGENNKKHYKDVKNGTNNKHNKAVVQHDLNGNIIAEFHSTTEAERRTGVHHSNISQCCKGNKNYSHAGGFKWLFKKWNEL